MKFLALSFLLLSVSASASPAKTVLEGMEAGALLGAFLDAGVRPAQVDTNIYAYSFEDLSCTYYSNSAIDGLFAGIPSYSCGDKFVKFGPSGSFAVWAQLEKVGAEVDCGMGKCYLGVKTLNCRMNDNEGEFRQKMRCELTFE